MRLTFAPLKARPLLVLVVVLTLMSSGCSSGTAPEVSSRPQPIATAETQAPKGSWVGRIAESAAFVAVVSGGDQIVGYVCENGKIGSWFFGHAPAGPEVSLKNANGDILHVQLGVEAVGTFTLSGGIERAFTAAPTDKPALYRADAVVDDKPVVGGWIHLGGEQQGTTSFNGEFQTAPRQSPDGELETNNFQGSTMQPTPMAPDTLSAAAANNTRFVWAAMGDSFAAGEGNPKKSIANRDDVSNFTGLVWGDDASVSVADNGGQLDADTLRRDTFTCHRSDNAPSPRAHTDLVGLYPDVKFQLGFVACSGAEIKDILGPGYTGPGANAESLPNMQKRPQPAQLDRIAKFKTTHGRLDAVYVSIGGNDLGFGPIITDCISPTGPHNCASVWDQKVTEGAATLRSRYATLDGELGTKIGPNVPILISLYPNPLHGTSSRTPPACQGDDYSKAEVAFGGFDDATKNNITPEEATFAFGVAKRLNGSVTSAQQTHQWTLVDAHVAPSEAHGMCTDAAFFNLNSKALRTQGRDQPDTWHFAFSSGFVHPNGLGYAEYKKAILAKMRPLIDRVIRQGLSSPVNLRIAEAKKDGALTIRWNDRAVSEDSFQVEVTPNREQDKGKIVFPAGSIRNSATGGYTHVVKGASLQQHVHSVSGGGQFRYRVRACHTAVASAAAGDTRCGQWSNPMVGTNVKPALPTDVKVVPSGQTRSTRVSWGAAEGAIEYVVRYSESGNPPVEKRTTALQATFSGTTGRGEVAVCNRVECTTYQRPV